MQRRNSFESGTLSNTIATSGSASPDAWDAVSIGAQATYTYDNAHVHAGSLAAKLVTGSAGTNIAYLQWAHGAVATQFGRVYLYGTVNGTDSIFLRAENAGAVQCALRFQNATNKIQLVNQAGTVVATMGTAISLNALCRIEWKFVAASGATGTMDARQFVGANVDGTTPDDSIGATSVVTSNDVQFDGVRLGNMANDSGLTYWFDDYEVNDTGYPGPAAVGATQRFLWAT